jgi:succinate dehydrogenase/fumarate reductase flavoprotein subunit
MKRLSADVAIIGTGGAGMMAALAAAEQGVDVLIVGKAAVGKGTCTSFAGGFFTSSSLKFSKEQHNAATLTTGGPDYTKRSNMPGEAEGYGGTPVAYGQRVQSG